MIAASGSRPVSRTGCLAILVVWLIATSLSCLALTLAMRGELTWRRGTLAEARLWLVNEAEAGGLGYSFMQVVSDETARGGPVCAQTRVFFLLWKGPSEQTAYCECYMRSPEGLYQSLGGCP